MLEVEEEWLKFLLVKMVELVVLVVVEEVPEVVHNGMDLLD